MKGVNHENVHEQEVNADEVDTEPWITRWMHQTDVTRNAFEQKHFHAPPDVTHDEGLIDKLSERWNRC